MRQAKAVTPFRILPPAAPAASVTRASVRISLTHGHRDAQLATLLASTLASHLVAVQLARRAIHVTLGTASPDMPALLDLLMSCVDAATIGPIVHTAAGEA